MNYLRPSVIMFLSMTSLFMLQIIFYYMDFPWNRYITFFAYLLPTFMLVMFLLINLREWIFLKLNIIDFFVASFFGLYLLSIAFSEIGIQQKFENLFFFFTSVATAYVCGKLFSIEDLQKLWNLFANFCAILVLLTTLDLLFFQTNDMRFQFFGLGHSPLILAYIFTFF